MAVPEPLWGLVLAGGKSRRMGSDKASLVNNGETQLARAVRLLESHLERVYVSSAQDQVDDPLRSAYKNIVDAYDDLGPVAGILSAMDAHPEVSWLVLACDLPEIDATTIRFLVENASVESHASAYRSVIDELPEPLCAIYRPSARAVIEQFVGNGFKCPRKMLINSPTCILEQPVPGALHNINSPEDLAGTRVEPLS